MRKKQPKKPVEGEVIPGSQVHPEMAKPSKKMAVKAAKPKKEEQSLLAVIERAASNPEVDVAKMEKLLEMHTKIVAKQAEDAFNIAMTAAQTDIRRIAADAENPQTRSKYATYAKLDRVLRPIYTKHGFSLSFDTDPNAPENIVPVKCYVSHVAGHTRTYHAAMPADGKGAKGGDVMTKTHATGSAMSYGMRYLLKMIFNVAIGAEDDDGNAAAAGPKIDEQQVAEINRLIKETDSGSGHYKEDFLCYLSKHGKVTISTVEEIPAVMFNTAKAALEAKKKKAVAHG